MNTIWLFPGQGSQAVGMGRELADAFTEAKEVFEEVDDALNLKLSHLMWNGSDDQLLLTENAQPAIMAVSMAVVRVLKKQAGIDVATTGRFAAGHSLGEYSAVAALNVLSLRDTAQILQIRGRAMQNATPAGEGGMIAVLGANINVLEEIISRHSGVTLANDNADGQVVLSGSLHDLGACAEQLKAVAKRVLPLPVSAPFHSPAMQPAADAVSNALRTKNINHAIKYPIISNVTALPEITGFDELLVQQITSRVRWREIMDFAATQDIQYAVELGNGNVLTNLTKRRLLGTTCINIDSTRGLEAFIATNV